MILHRMIKTAYLSKVEFRTMKKTANPTSIDPEITDSQRNWLTQNGGRTAADVFEEAGELYVAMGTADGEVEAVKVGDAEPYHYPNSRIKTRKNHRTIPVYERKRCTECRGTGYKHENGKTYYKHKPTCRERSRS